MIIKIMVVDDEPDVEHLIRQLFRKDIRNGVYHFVFACDGVDAIAKINTHTDIDIILSDINMPRMNGLELLKRTKVISPLVKTVIISAYGDMHNIREAMNNGAFDFVTKPFDINDLRATLSKTIKHVDQLKSTIRAIQENDILKMYVNADVINFMTTRDFQRQLLSSEIIDGSVCFIDICGFTRLSETIEPNLVVKLLNTYFDEIVKDIIAFDGRVDKFIGDAIMASFIGDDHLVRALDACLSIRSRIDSIHVKVDAPLDRLPGISIGVNSGRMLMGNIGSESLKRLDYTVIGDVVNTASRYQGYATEGQCCTGEDIYDRIRKLFKCEKLSDVALKNKALPVTVYNVLRKKP